LPAGLAGVCPGARVFAGSLASGGYVASIERTASSRFKQAIPVREMHEAFTPAAGEIA
jgi:hypothetical protein